MPRAGVACEEISVGATPTARHSLKERGITELRPGNYAYFDRTQVGLGAAAWSDCALTVLARVVSRPARGRVILDSGSKTLTSDGARGFSPAPGHGAVSLPPVSRQRPAVGLVAHRVGRGHRLPAARIAGPGVPGHR